MIQSGGASTAEESSRSAPAPSRWTTRERELELETRTYARSAPQLRNRLIINDRGDIDGVEGTQAATTMQGEQLEMDSPGGSEGSIGLDILSRIAGSRSDTDEDGVGEQSQELL